MIFWGVGRGGQISKILRFLPKILDFYLRQTSSLGSRREAFLSQNISTCLCSFTFNPAFHQNSKVFSYNLALPLIFWSSL